MVGNRTCRAALYLMLCRAGCSTMEKALAMLDTMSGFEGVRG